MPAEFVQVGHVPPEFLKDTEILQGFDGLRHISEAKGVIEVFYGRGNAVDEVIVVDTPSVTSCNPPSVRWAGSSERTWQNFPNSTYISGTEMGSARLLKRLPKLPEQLVFVRDTGVQAIAELNLSETTLRHPLSEPFLVPSVNAHLLLGLSIHVASAPFKSMSARF